LDAAEAVEAVPGVGGEGAALLVDAADGAALVVEVVGVSVGLDETVGGVGGGVEAVAVGVVGVLLGLEAGSRVVGGLGELAALIVGVAVGAERVLLRDDLAVGVAGEAALGVLRAWIWPNVPANLKLSHQADVFLPGDLEVVLPRRAARRGT
jgi:hypothetical protein